jgi:hypothetical protein
MVLSVLLFKRFSISYSFVILLVKCVSYRKMHSRATFFNKAGIFLWSLYLNCNCWYKIYHASEVYFYFLNSFHWYYYALFYCCTFEYFNIKYNGYVYILGSVIKYADTNSSIVCVRYTTSNVILRSEYQKPFNIHTVFFRLSVWHFVIGGNEWSHLTGGCVM